MERQLLAQPALRALLLAVLLAVSACSSPTRQDTASSARIEPGAQLLPPAPVTAAAPVLAPPTDVWERIRRQLSLHTLHNARIGAAREYYLRQPRFMELIAPRAEAYLYYLVSEVERRGLPIELALLPVVESALDPLAYSGQGAAGLWQIMPSTADYLGMRRDWWFDARFDLRESTAHALDYLAGLNEDFEGDWLLALAAYNAGKARVRRAVARNARAGRATDYWSLDLPRETRHYVPRLIALSTLIAFDRALGITLPPVANSPALVEVDTGGQIEMLRVARLAQMPLDELRRLNAGQQRWATAPRGNGTLLLPPAIAPSLREALASLPPSERVTWEHYRIRRGDSLIRIARRFDTEVGLLRDVNNLRGNLIRAGDTLMIPNSAAWERSLALTSGERSGEPRGYTVRRGDSLYLIASRFDVSIDDIINWNRLDPAHYLQPGQSLTLFVGGD